MPHFTIVAARVMDRPKHRRFILLGLVLLAGGMLLVGRHWFFTPTEQPTPVPAATVAAPTVETQPDEAEPAGEATASEPTPPSAPTATTGGFRGKVVDAVTRRPMKEFEVRLIRVKREQHVYSEDEPITRTFQSKTGRFAWNDVEPATWRAAVVAHGYQHFDISEFKIVAGKTTREAVMPLLRGFSVRGRVFERSTGAGIPDAWVSFKESSAWRGDFRQKPHVKSKDDGTFVLDGVPGGDMTLTVGAQDHAYRELELVVDEKTLPQEIALSTGGTIAGMVTTTDGRPIKLDIMLDGPDIGYHSQTNETGQFSFKHMRAGRYQLRTIGAAGSARQDIELGPDERKEDIVLTVAAGRSVRGVVRGLQPEQLKKSFISLHSATRSASFSTRLDEQGSYAFNGVPPGRAQLSAYSEGRQLEKTVDVPADQDVVFDIAFPAGARLSGRVTQDGKPVANRTVWMGPADRKAGSLYRARTSEDGQYEIEGLPSGDYRVRADEDISRPITIAGDAVLNIDIPLVQLSGRVQENGGKVPIVGADIYVRGVEPATARVRAYKVADDFGEFSLTGIEPGEIVVTVYKAGYELHREKLVYSSPITSKTIGLRKGGGVEVRAQRAARKEPVRGIMLTEKVPGSEYGIDFWIPLDREGVGSMPSGLAGSTLKIYGPGDKEIVIEEWDGQALELKL